MPNPNERSPLLRQSSTDSNDDGDEVVIKFEDDDPDNPRAWKKSKKMMNIALIALMAILSTLASAMFTPGVKQIAKDLDTTEILVTGATTAYVVTIGIGPLILAPLSETFGRRKLYIWCFSVFSVLQIPTAMSKNIGVLIFLRVLAGFFGSIGIANGGGTISDMFKPQERAGIFGWYLLGPLLGPSLGPLVGGIVIDNLNWRWIFWILSIACGVIMTAAYFLLHETYAPVLLEQKCERKRKESPDTKYKNPEADDRSLSKKLGHALTRPIRILFTQPIVFTMAMYQAVLFGIMYSLFTNMQEIYGEQYGFSTTQVGLVYLGPGTGFILAVLIIVPRIDTVYNKLTEKNDGEAKPEFRLPLANIGAVLLPCSLFVFAWTVEYKLHWAYSVVAMGFFGFGEVSIFNTSQNYYIDSFSKAAASAIAAGSLFRSVVGGIVPLFVPALFNKLGYGWGWSCGAFACVALAPAPILFYKFGQRLREKFAIEL